MNIPGPVQGVVRTPTVLQMEALECGAAALALVLAHYGRWTPLEELRVLCGVSRDGSKAVNILKAARSFGFKAYGKRQEPADLATLPVPAILFVGMNHFVVFEGVTRTGFQVNDPASGRRILSPEDFDGQFTGLVLVFEPTEDFRPEGTPPRVLPRLLDMLQGSWGMVGLMALASGFSALFILLLPGLQRIYVDRILIEQIDDWVVPLVVTLAVLAPLVAFLNWLQGRLIASLNAKLSIVLSSRLTWHVLRLPVLFFAQRYAGMIASRIALSDQLVTTLTQSLSQFLTYGTLMLMLVLLMAQYSLLLTGLVVGMALCNALLFKHLRKAMGEASEKVAMQMVKMNGKVMQGVRMMETLKSTGTDDMFFSQWAGFQALYINAQQVIARREALVAALQTWLASLSTAAVLVVGGYFTLNEQFTIGMLVAFSTVSLLFNQPVTLLVNLAGIIQQTQGVLAQVDDTLRYPQAREFSQHDDVQENMPSPDSAILGRLSGQVRIEGLTFGYAPLDPPLIEGFSLEMAPGSRVALVGGSGSGKSTIGKLLAGLLEPQSGRILFDGRPMTAIARETLRNSLAVVDQDIVLFNGTVRDNISLWDDTMPEENLTGAAKDAQIHDLILGRRKGYDALIEENGRNLSGGQRQRLEIARALAGNPTVLVLDEATSALDTVTEEAIMSRLRRRGCTCLIIAHRLSTIRDCDEIVVMHQGKILQRGVHADLIAQDGPYRRLIET
jgi:NHLM bacteriocin system ABC transporter peptidase/ATP-binding protein